MLSGWSNRNTKFKVTMINFWVSQSITVKRPNSKIPKENTIGRACFSIKSLAPVGMAQRDNLTNNPPFNSKTQQETQISWDYQVYQANIAISRCLFNLQTQDKKIPIKGHILGKYSSRLERVVTYKQWIKQLCLQLCPSPFRSDTT